MKAECGRQRDWGEDLGGLGVKPRVVLRLLGFLSSTASLGESSDPQELFQLQEKGGKNPEV